MWEGYSKKKGNVPKLRKNIPKNRKNKNIEYGFRS